MEQNQIKEEVQEESAATKTDEYVQTEEEIQAMNDCVKSIDEMLMNDKYDFANDFLSSVREFAKTEGFLTASQIQGVANVKNSVKW